MTRFLLAILITVSLFTAPVSCTPDIPAGNPVTGLPQYPAPDNTDEDEEDTNINKPMDNTVTIKIGNSVFTASLSDNEAARSFQSMLPMTVRMDEHAGNEKYYNLATQLPVNTFRPGTIQAGDLMLWGNDCLVLFYKTFSSSYSYTRLGRIENPAGIAAAVGSGSVTVSFE